MAEGDGAPISSKVVVTRRQKSILDMVYKGIGDLDQISRELGFRREDLMRDVEELRARGLIEIAKEEVRKPVLREEGREYLEKGFPEERLSQILERRGRVRLEEVPRLAGEMGLELDPKDAGIGLQYLIRNKAVRVEKGEICVADMERLRESVSAARSLRSYLESIAGGATPKDKEVLALLSRRRAVDLKAARIIKVRLTERASKLLRRGLVEGARIITALTPKIIASGEWIGSTFKEYDFSVEPPRLYPGKKHPYLELLDQIRDILVSMGFEEMRGPHVEMELWNFDALFQAQDHPAREIHDTYFLKEPRYGRFHDRKLIERIARTHENGWITGSKGWGYSWDPRRALRLILRTQTTAVSARTLYERGDGEYRCFSLDRVFRPESLDAKHSMEFYQLEGIIVGRKVTFRHLIGFFHEMARRLDLGPVKIKPGYFPFTEPSVEGFIRHPKLGWIEVFPGGMFRPEMLIPLGVRRSNVAAWGIGIDRIAMAVLGIDDIRLLFSQDLEFLRKSRKPFLKSMIG